MFGFFIKLLLIWLVVMLVVGYLQGWYYAVENAYRWMLPN